MSSAELRSLAAELLTSLSKSHPLGYEPRLIWKKLRVSAGMAYYRRGEIALSSVVLVTEEQMRTTLIHEYAHLLAVKRHGLRAGGHGLAWKQAMLDLGAEPKVRHNYEVLRNKPRQRVTYRCVKCGSEFDRSRRLPKRRRYVHANCGGALKLKEVSTAEPNVEEDRDRAR